MARRIREKLEKLTLCRFRAATCPVDLEFDPHKGVAMVFGENGTGKSTLADAIDFVCNEKCGSLAEKSSTNPRQHLPAIGSKASDVVASLTFGGRTWDARLVAGRPASSGPPDRPKARILRRGQILEVINAEPRERYEALKGFIEVPVIERSERSLRDALNALKREVDAAQGARKQAEDSLARLWKQEGEPGDGPLSWARALCTEDLSALEANARSARQLLDAVTACLEARRELDDSGSAHSKAVSKRDVASSELRKAQQEAGQNLSLLSKVLEDAEAFLKATRGVTKCPVCEQAVDAEKLQRELRARLDEMKGIVELGRALDTAAADATNVAAVVTSKNKDFVAAGRRMAHALRSSDALAVAIEWSDYRELTDTDPVRDEEAGAVESRTLLGLVEAHHAALQRTVQTMERTLGERSALTNQVGMLEEATERLQTLGKTANKLEGMLAVVERERKAYVSRVLEDVSADVERMYLQLHPDEGLGGIRLYLKPTVSGSLELAGTFESRESVPVQAYYSDSHLDTLGVCVFLALSKYFADERTILVLDDVLTSADTVHLERLIELLHQEAAHFSQVVITTHYRPWRDKYRFARGATGNVQLIELLPWSLLRGIRHTKTRLCVEELEECAEREPFDRQTVSAKAGVLLESLLDHVVLLYNCKVPRKAEENYTLGELLDALGKRLKPRLRVEMLKSDGTVEADILLESLIDSIGGLAWIRNQIGCHWNVAGMEVSDAEVSMLAKYTVMLGEELICPECGRLPSTPKSGDFWECRCGRRRLHPLGNPDHMGGLPPR